MRTDPICRVSSSLDGSLETLFYPPLPQQDSTQASRDDQSSPVRSQSRQPDAESAPLLGHNAHGVSHPHPHSTFIVTEPPLILAMAISQHVCTSWRKLSAERPVMFAEFPEAAQKDVIRKLHPVALQGMQILLQIPSGPNMGASCRIPRCRLIRLPWAWCCSQRSTAMLIPHLTGHLRSSASARGRSRRPVSWRRPRRVLW